MRYDNEDRALECLQMAGEASRKAEAAEGPAEAQFWRRMEQRWLRLARTYHETDKLTAAWLAGSADDPAPRPFG
jgi:hypothetical protein